MPPAAQENKPHGKVASSILAIHKRFGTTASTSARDKIDDQKHDEPAQVKPPLEGLMRSRFATSDEGWQQVPPQRAVHSRKKVAVAKPLKSSQLNNDPAQYRVQTQEFYESKARIVVVDWAEPAGPTKSEHNVTRTRLGSRVFGKPRYFAVVQTAKKFCYVVALSTHGQQGTGHLDSREHGIAYKGTVAPAAMPGEEGLQPIPIQVVLDNPDEDWNPRSRIAYRKIYNLEYHVRVRPCGYIAEASLPAYFDQLYQVSGFDFRPNKSALEVQSGALYERLRTEKKLSHKQAVQWVQNLFDKSEGVFELNLKMANL